MKKLFLILPTVLLLTSTASAQEEKTSDKTVFTIVQEMPRFPGGDEGLDKYLRESIVYPDMALEKGIQGKVYITCVIDELGNVTEARVLRGIGGGCDEEALRVIQAMPRWTPGKQNGHTVKVQYNLPIQFSMPESRFGFETVPKDTEALLLTNRMKLPEFPGGDDALFAYLEKNITYPANARKRGLTGKGFLEFTVTKEGQITNVKAIEPVFSSLSMNDQTLRVIKEMPKWEPGTKEGKIIAVTFHLSINY